ncbi:MAG: sulfurtransferase [Bacteroidetes bacterium]|jgi:thiosulfate/3-mercaptopyruvate sulfurtransferase|nr:sulfurtransferase [Bacteroidota bacterium]
MPHTTLISAQALHAHLDDPDWAVVDCRFALDDPEAGRRAYEAAHVPGAVYAHLDDDLSGPIVPGVTGRHPLPSVDEVAETLSAWGIDADVQVGVYDDAGGALAARLWWMLRWLGHDAAAVLDGGWPAWQAAGFPTCSGVEQRPRRTFVPEPCPDLIVDAEDVEALRTDPRYRLLDARAAVRYRGEEEPLDPVAGHIPGARSAPYADNLKADQHLRSPEALRERFEAIIGETPAERVVCYCGSGVTAAHDLLAFAHAGLGLPRLYPGSWSEWITDPDRPVAPETD